MTYLKSRTLQQFQNIKGKVMQVEYEKEASGLKSLFAFDNPILDIKGFTSAAEFSATFPFVPYQFIVIQKVLAEIRKHGNSGKHLSGGERSMLSGFQEAAQKIENKDENALVPFYQFYDTVHMNIHSTRKKNSAKVIPTGSRLSAMAVHMRDYIPAIASMALCLMRRMYARLDCLRVRQKSIVARWHFMIWNMWTC